MKVVLPLSFVLLEDTVTEKDGDGEGQEVFVILET